MGLINRLARARAMGFNTERRLYHGTRRQIEAFDNRMLGTNTRAPSAAQAHFFTDDPMVASAYTERLGIGRPDAREVRGWAQAAAPHLLPKIAKWESGGLKGKALWDLEDELIEAYERAQAPNVIPVFARDTNLLEHDFGGRSKIDGAFSFDELLERARAEGRRGAVFRNVYDLGNNPDGSRRYSNVYAFFDPSDVRSINAQFAPERAGSSDLLAGLAVGAPTGLLAMANMRNGRAAG